MEYKAAAKYLRHSTRKVRLVTDSIRHLSVENACIQLSRMPKRACLDLKKVIDSAVANAKVKNGKNVGDLRFVRIDVNEGPSMKRWHAVSKGTAHTYKKRMTHINVILTDDDTNTGKTIADKGEKMSNA